MSQPIIDYNFSYFDNADTAATYCAGFRCEPDLDDIDGTDSTTWPATPGKTAEDAFCLYDGAGAAKTQDMFTATWARPMPSSNYVVSLDVNPKTDQSGVASYTQGFRLCGRGTYDLYSTTASCYFLLWTGSRTSYAHIGSAGITATANTVHLYRLTAGTAVLLDSYALTFPTEDRWHNLRIAVNGRWVGGYVDDVLVVEYSDTAAAVLAGPGHVGWEIVYASSSGYSMGRVDNFRVYLLEADKYDTCQSAYDESRRVIKFAMPSSGSDMPQQIFNYHIDSGEWTIENHAVSCLGNTLDDTGEEQVIYGEPTDKKLYRIDGSATWSGSAIDAVWTSNWLKISEQHRNGSLERLQTIFDLTDATQYEITVETADDPSDPRTYQRKTLIAGYLVNDPIWFGVGGKWARFSVRHNQATGTMKLRQVMAEILY